jgi:hypothetical protein
VRRNSQPGSEISKVAVHVFRFLERCTQEVDINIQAMVRQATLFLSIIVTMLRRDVLAISVIATIWLTFLLVSKSALVSGSRQTILSRPVTYLLSVGPHLSAKLAHAEQLWQQAVEGRKEMVAAMGRDRDFPDGYIAPLQCLHAPSAPSTISTMSIHETEELRRRLEEAERHQAEEKRRRIAAPRIPRRLPCALISRSGHPER